MAVLGLCVCTRFEALALPILSMGDMFLGLGKLNYRHRSQGKSYALTTLSTDEGLHTTVGFGYENPILHRLLLPRSIDRNS